MVGIHPHPHHPGEGLTVSMRGPSSSWDSHVAPCWQPPLSVPFCKHTSYPCLVRIKFWLGLPSEPGTPPWEAYLRVPIGPAACHHLLSLPLGHGHNNVSGVLVAVLEWAQSDRPAPHLELSLHRDYDCLGPIRHTEGV